MERKVTATWRIFVHIDVSHGIDRIHGDHDPVNALYGTELWEPGNIILDEKEMRVPRNVRKGRYTIYVGFFAHDTRMAIIAGPHDTEKRAVLGTIDVI